MKMKMEMKIDHIDTTQIYQGLDVDTNIVNTKNLCMMILKQHLRNIWSSIHEKVNEHSGWVEKKCCL